MAVESEAGINVRKSDMKCFQAELRRRMEWWLFLWCFYVRNSWHCLPTTNKLKEEYASTLLILDLPKQISLSNNKVQM